MAEAHSAVAFSFTVTPEGVDVNLNHEALRHVWHSGVLSWKKWIGRKKNDIINGIFPAAPSHWLFFVTLVLALKIAGIDCSFGYIDGLAKYLLGPEMLREYLSCIIMTTLAWILKINLLKYSLRFLLSYQQWMYEVRGPISLRTKIWKALVYLTGGRQPLLNSYRASLPKLPVPSIKDTVRRYLRSVRPLLDDTNFMRMERLAADFQTGIANKLQRYLVLKSWWASNYVSDWWEEYVYLSGRSPIMINSNFYGMDAIFVEPTEIQAARAANMIYCILMYRRECDRQELKPMMVNKMVPLCSAQYERQFNTTRIPGLALDTLVHLQDSNHIVVYHHGRYFKVYFRHRGQLLKPCELEIMLQRILDDKSEPAVGEEHLAALTAGDRIPWAKARKEYFSRGKNKASLDAVEKACFFLAFEDEVHRINKENCNPDVLSAYGRSMLHGKGYDRWFDKSFNLVVCSNGRIGINAEHSWADAPITAHMCEYMFAEDNMRGYDENGHTKGEPSVTPPNPIRLEWELPEECVEVIEQSLSVARQLIKDVDLYVMQHDAFGKGFIKTCKISPDAFIQMAFQLAYYRDAGRFCLTYEATMTRLFREGRTETVRSCTIESEAFVKAMQDKTKTNKERRELLRKAADNHQKSIRDAMTGKGIDRHLFCLYVVSKYLKTESPFLSEVLSEPWRLSTSQTPHQQTDKLDLVRHPEHISAGGGFGPVADDGYGVSYMIAGEESIFFHVSCKRSCGRTNSTRFGQRITTAFSDIKDLFQSD